ncbi:hypothetical protein ES332_D12G077200v1 [Gossypium tomentosum]|uniref:TF-B3 domain-containing protein n=1 Tax=Gossypium tomentosum TaxID=34277 RepID=A0A5D2I7P6_GOSTO|nr:hypothetical protein ES332_D12G077200v1 [Gossypium tomentosum]
MTPPGTTVSTIATTAFLWLKATIEHTPQQPSIIHRSMFTSKTPHFFKSTDEKLHLQNGWREFAEHYLLEFGSFVVFRYEGNDRFHVLIFDKSASEIDYPYTSTEDDDGDGDGDDHISVGVIAARPSVKTEVLSCPQKLTDTEKAQAVQIASAFKSTEHPVFMVLMRPSSLCYKYRMVIPLDFALKFLPKHNCNLTLCNSAGKTWPMMFYRNTESKKLSAQLYGGWKTFVKDNRINVGDICVFELIRQPEILMKVQIYPAAKNASNACRSQADNSIASQLRTGSLVSVTEPDCQQTRCPYSSSELKDSKLKTQKNINFQYSTKELRALGSIVSRVKTRSLVSDAKRSCQQSARLPSSREFIDLTDSYIESLDDSPLDQKTKKKMTSPSFQPCELKYSVKNDSGRRSSARRCPKPDPVYGKQRACVGASAFRTSNPSFSVVIQPSYIGSSSALILTCWQHIPVEFVKRYLKKSGEMVLRVADGRIWIVEYRRTASNKGRKAKFGSRSWGQFAKDNQLEVGDVCVFELMNENGNLLEVAIHRKHLLIEID